MADPNPTSNPPQGPRNRHPLAQVRGQVLAPSDRASALRASQSHRAGHNLSTQSPQRSSDPLRYDTQSTPYWDDANGAIHNMYSTPSRISAPAYAQNASGEIRRTNSQQSDVPARPPPQAAFHNSYLDIAGDGPYGYNQAMYTEAGIAGVAAIGKRANRRDFTPYFDAADARNGMDLGSPRIDGLRNALAKRDVNQKLRQNSAEAGEAVTEKLSEPRAPPRASLGKLPSTAPKLQSKAEIPALLKAPRASVAPASGPTSYQWPGALTPVVEAPSPLNISSTNQSNRPSKHRRTSTLDRILDIRAEEQAKALTQLEGELYKSSDIKQDEQQTPNPSSHRVGNVESRRIAHPTLRKDKQQGSKYNTSPDSSENQNGSHIRTSSDSVAPAKRVSASSSVYSNDENTQEDEIVRLSKAIVGLRAFQDLPSSSLNKAALQRKSAVPDGLDMSKIGVGKRESNDGNEAQQANREKSLIEAQAEILEYFNVPLEATGPGKADAQTSSSQESCVTASSGDYEKIGSQETLEQEENGVKRRWYKGFRRV